MTYERPLVISQVSFDRKSQFENGVLFLGDSASMIAPLCGNGMSMAMQSARIAAKYITRFLQGEISHSQLGEAYSNEWSSAFSRRLYAGRLIQGMFGREWVTNFAIEVFRKMPGLFTSVIRQTHGSSKV
jgi:flavin-dependent dehydrogenase